MYKLCIAVLLILQTVTLKAQDHESNSNTSNIEVQLENIINNNGVTLIALYKKEGFMSRTPVQSGKAKIMNGKAHYTFKDVAPGTYAVVALHDENENNRMDYEASGMPLEGWTASGNDMTMGPPNFESSKFEVEEKDLQLTLRF